MFSYEDYRQIIEIIKETGRQEFTYQNALGKDRFILMMWNTVWRELTSLPV